MSKIKLLLGLVLLISFNSLFSQNLKATFNEADAYLEDENWTEAVKYFQQVYTAQPENGNVQFKLGYCYLNMNQPKRAIRYLKEAVSRIDAKETEDNYDVVSAPLETYYYLGQAYHLDYQFQKSIDFLTLLKNQLSQDETDFLIKIDQIINWDKNGILLMKYPVKMDVINLGDSINSTYEDHSPVFSADESVLLFTSRREGSVGGKLLEDNQYDEDIYITHRNDDGFWKKAQNMGTPVNTVNHDATIGLSVDGQMLLIYRDDNGDGNIYYSNLNGDQWSAPKKFPAPVNSKSRETDASLSADGQTLFFTSDRKGGLGGLDIYMSRKLPTGDWGIPQNLGPNINTPYNDEGPYIHPDGVTLFFSSKGHQSIGGYDIFFSMLNEETGKWEEPTNIGYPINTTGDDVFYLPTPDGKRAYYASSQYDSKGKTDIYLISLPEAKEKELTVMSGYVIAGDGTVPQNMMITVTDVETQEEIGIFTPNSKTGKYLFILKPGKTYDVLVEADNYLYYSEKIEVKKGTAYQQIKRAIKLDPIILGNLQANYFIKFKENSTKLSNGIIADLENMAKFMFVNENLHVNIFMKDGSDNTPLNQKRKDALKKYLMAKGVSANRIHIDERKPNAINLIIIPDPSEKQIVENQDANNNDNTQQDTSSTNNTVVPAEGDVTMSDMLFDFDKYETHAYDKQLDVLASYLVANPTAVIMVHGHTDSQGTDEYNDALGLRRAKFVKDYLVSRGVNPKTLRIKSHGEKDLIAIDLNSETRHYNRRVEFQIIKQGKNKLTVLPMEMPDAYKIK
ncbi:MAG: PD40 domain-containing protein [Bacteroidales bacterium]|nr:PD40 domain-containing protein [Bacteroidales bacterium]